MHIQQKQYVKVNKEKSSRSKNVNLCDKILQQLSAAMDSDARAANTGAIQRR